MTITVEQMVQREVHYCVSYLVSTLAQGAGECRNLQDIVEQACDLAAPIDDWEEAAIQEGWKISQDGAHFVDAGGLESWADPRNACGWEDLCRERDIEPYQCEVYEHWIVSDWLADHLAARGEKVDKDFAGLTIWARTTTGQGIASDSVIQAIHAALVGASGESV